MNNLRYENFKKEIVEKKGLSLIKFGASWCGPCRAFAPILNETEKLYQGKIDFYDVDVDSNQDLAVKFAVRGVPATFLVKDGEVVGSFVGMRSKNELIEILREFETG